MQKSKFSIGLDESDLELLDKFITYFNHQHLIMLDRAKAIRILLRVGLKMQEIIPACHAEEVEWVHLAVDSQIDQQKQSVFVPFKGQCGASSLKIVPITLEKEITCPKCMMIARHHHSKTSEDS